MMISPADFYERTIAEIDRLREAKPELKALLDFWKDVLKAQSAAQESFRPDLSRMTEEYCRSKASSNSPFLTAEDLRMDWNLFENLFNKLSGLASRHANDEKTMRDWPTVAETSGEWRSSLLSAVFGQEGLFQKCAEPVRADLNRFIFLACQTCSPFAATYADALRQYVDENSWLRGTCPLCGGEPLMARLAEETGKRHLQCFLCRTEWLFKRLECPFCSNSNQRKLQFFQDETDPAHRVDVCMECKAYLKTVDLRHTESKMTLFVENLATIHLDVVAREEGFRRQTNKLFGL